MTLKNSCEGIQAPSGWKFKDCDDRFITLLRQKKAKWEPRSKTWEGLKKIASDAFVASKKITPYSRAWGDTAYEFGGSSELIAEWGFFRRSKEFAVKEVACLANGEEARLTSLDEGERRQLKVFLNKLAECRRRLNINERKEWSEVSR